MRGNEELIKNFYHKVKSAVDEGWPLDPNGTNAERDNQQNQRNAKNIEFTVRGLRPTGLKRKAHEHLIEHANATWDALQTQITSKDVIYTINSELVPNATSDQNTKLHSLEQQIKELTALFKEQQGNQVTQPNPRPANVDNKSRQNKTRFCSYCRRKGHTLMYYRTEAIDDENKRQQTRNNQERRTVFTHDYNKRRGPNFGSQNNQNFNQQPRYGNQNNQIPNRQTGFIPDRNRNPNSDRQYHQNRSSNSWNNGPDHRQQTQYNFNARPENSDTQYNRNFPQSNNLSTSNSVQFIDDQGRDVIKTLIRFLSFKLLKSPRPDEESYFKSRFHMNAFYFSTGDNQRESGLEIEIMLNTGAACSIINYRTFLEIAQFRQPITVVRSKQKTKTYTGDIVSMIGHTTLSFSFDSDGEHQFELRFWITETQTSNLLGIELCRQYVSKMLFEISAIELKNTANAMCYGYMCSTKPYPFVSKIHTIRTPHQIHVDAKTSRDWKCSSEDKSKIFPPGTTFVPHRHYVKSGLDFVNVLCTQSEDYLPILMEDNRNHQITLNKGVFRYSSLDISDRDRPKYQIRDCVQMANSNLSENDQYKECFLLHSTVPCEPDLQDKIQTLNGNNETIFQANTAIAHCISADAKMSKRFAETICRRVDGLQQYCQKNKATVGSALSIGNLNLTTSSTIS